MKLAINELTLIGPTSNVTPTYEIKDNSLLMTKGDFKIVITPELMTDSAVNFYFEPVFSLDNVSGTPETSAHLNRALKTLLERNYLLNDSELKVILTQLNKGLRFKIYVMGSVYEFSSFHYVFKALNHAFDTLSVNWLDIAIPLNHYKIRPSYTCSLIEKEKIIGVPSRLVAVNNSNLLIQQTNGTTSTLMLRAAKGLSWASVKSLL